MRHTMMISKAACAAALAFCLGCGESGNNPATTFPPQPPSNPQPANGATKIGIYTSISWECSDPLGQQLSYDLYLGTNPHPPIYGSRLRQNSYTLYDLAYDSVYYWKVAAIDEYYNVTIGPIWSFRTATQNEQPPRAPYSPSPSNGYSSVHPNNVTLNWQYYDLSGATLTFNVFLGTTAQPPLVSSNLQSNNYVAGQLLDNVTYYWRVEAVANQAVASSPVWRFTTGTSINQAPNQPVISSPADSAIDIRVTTFLRWASYDPDDDPITYRLYFGTMNPPPFVGNQFNSSYAPPDTLQYGMQYYWNVVAMDNHGHETSGPVWTFSTRPGNVSRIGSYAIGYSANLSFQGNYVFLGGYNNLDVVDISDAAAMHEEGECDLTANGVYDIFAAGSYAYLACGDSTLKIIDITNPAAPSVFSQFHLGVRPSRLYVLDTYAYLPYYSGGILVADISDPMHPVESGRIGSLYARDLAVTDDYLYTIGNPYGLQAIDISDLSNPYTVGTLPAIDAISLLLRGDRLYLAGASGLQIIDISNPMNLSLAGTFSVDPEDFVFVSGNYAYLNSHDSGLIIVDISAPDHLRLAGSSTIRSFPGNTSRLYVSGSFVFMMEYGTYDIVSLQFTP